MVAKDMKSPLFINTNSGLRLLFLVAAICLPGLTGCSSLDAGTEKGVRTALVGKMDPSTSEDHLDPNVFVWTGDHEDPVAANRNWYQMID